MPFFLYNFFHHYVTRSNVLYCIRITITLLGVTLLPWWLNHVTLVIPLTLGVVAAATTDLDDRLIGRLQNLLITLICFAIASVSIELLMPFPWLFALGLCLSTWGFIMLGALGQRYAAIAFGALLIALYTMLGYQMYDNWYMQPLLLLAGSLWYHFIAIIGHLFFPIRVLQDNLTTCYNQLAFYLDAKSTLFDADEQNNFKPQLINLAVVNATLIRVFNTTKFSLLTRLKNQRGFRKSQRLLHYYFIAQDIHERISSIHFNYQIVSDKLRYTDILFRFQRLISLQASACRQVARSIELRKPYQHDMNFERLFQYLNHALTRLEYREHEAQHLIQPLHNLVSNLQAVNTQLANIESIQGMSNTLDQQNMLEEETSFGVKEMWHKIKQELTPDSVLFRHAIRMSLVLCCGYSIVRLFNLEEGQGYWIMLTSLFVCQPNYSATKQRLRLRVVGTLLGIVTGLPLLYLIPSIEGQLIIIILSGTFFFSCRSNRYAYATMFITILVLTCFNLLGQRLEIILPRVIDTLLGCGIAWAAVTFIWPDWKFRKFPHAARQAIIANGYYLNAILGQYRYGKNDHLTYRAARRKAHNCDAELSFIASSLSSEPKQNPHIIEESFQILGFNHTLLGYISALGAHRAQLDTGPTLQLINNIGLLLIEILQNGGTFTPTQKHQLYHFDKELAESALLLNQYEQLILQQFTLIVRLLPKLALAIESFTSSDEE